MQWEAGHTHRPVVVVVVISVLVIVVLVMLVLIVIVVLAIVPAAAALVAIAVVVIVVIVIVLVAIVVVVIFSPGSNHLLQLQLASQNHKKSTSAEPLRQRMSGQPGLREPLTGATAC